MYQVRIELLYKDSGTNKNVKIKQVPSAKVKKLTYIVYN